VATHPHSADIIFVGTENGGVWRTFNGLQQNPTWEPVTDQMLALSIGKIVFSPLNADGVPDPTFTSSTPVTAATLNKTVLYAGIGTAGIQPSSFRTGLLKSLDGGTTWQQIGIDDLLGFRVTSIVATDQMTPTGQRVFISVDNKSGTERSGVFRSDDGGLHWTRLSAKEDIRTDGVLPPGLRISDLVEDPEDRNGLFAGVAGEGVFHTTDNGNTWTKVNGSGNTALTGIDPSLRIDLAVRNYSLPRTGLSIGVIYAAVIGAPKQSVTGIFRSDDGGSHWTKMDALAATFTKVGVARFSMAADPNDPNVVFIGGEAQP